MFMIPSRIPACALRMLARSEWFSDPGLLLRAQLAPANALARFLSSPFFSKRSDIAAITLGHNVYFRAARYFDPHSAAGLSLLAHELKHVEQVERGGLAGFYLGYVRDYVHSGYGEFMPQEAEAYQLGRSVYAHMQAEMAANADHPCCLGADGAHVANPDFVLMTPLLFRARLVGTSA